MIDYEIVINGRRFDKVMDLHIKPHVSFLTYLDEETNEAVTYAFETSDIDLIKIAAAEGADTP